MDKKIDHLTEMMKDLALSVCTLQNNISPSTTKNIQSQPPPISSTNLLQPNNSAFSSQSDWPEGVTKCSYCCAPDHYLKRHCQVFQDDLNSNQIHMKDNQKICLEPYTPGARHVFIRQRKPGPESIANAKKLCYLFLPLANVQTLKIGDAEPDPYLSYDEV